MTPTLDDLRNWLAEHMPSLSRETSSLRDSALHARLCEQVGMERGADLRIVWRKLKQAHYGD